MKLAEALISRETLDTDELEAIFRGETLPPKVVRANSDRRQNNRRLNLLNRRPVGH